MTIGPIIECQDCGAVLLVLTPEQAAKVAERPQNFVIYCDDCWRDRNWEAMGRDN